jgi:hypothetical protein
MFGTKIILGADVSHFVFIINPKYDESIGVYTFSHAMIPSQNVPSMFGILV